MRCAIIILSLLAVAGCKNLEATIWFTSTHSNPSKTAQVATLQPAASHTAHAPRG
jgi:hypothetical protein